MNSNREERLIYIEKLLHQCESDLIRMREMNEELKRIIEVNDELSAYYSNEYLSDYENQEILENEYRALDQDSIWNAISGQHLEKITLLKTIINSIE